MTATIKPAVQAPSFEGTAPAAESGAAAPFAWAGAGVSLRSKALFFAGGVFLYALIAMLVIVVLWRGMEATDHKVDRMHETETRVELLQSSLSHAIINLQDAMKSGNVKDLDTDVALLLSDAGRLHSLFPELEPMSARIGRDVGEVLRHPLGAGAEVLRDGLEIMSEEVKKISTRVHEGTKGLVDAQLQHQRNIAVLGGVFALLGVATMGGLILLFFNRLAQDIVLLGNRAVGIVRGHSVGQLKVTRSDELGALMTSVNVMQDMLRERDRQVELARQERYYQDKMAAIGSLAAGVAHEINNPIAAISGIAQHIKENRQTLNCVQGGCQPELILEQTNRIAAISRQLAELATERSESPELVDLNGLVERTCSFIGYDRRFRKVTVKLDLDRQLPAVNVVADHITQVLMNLLINAADALEGEQSGRGVICVLTRLAEGIVQLTVRDNGHGMDADLLARVFDESFTTKPPDRGRGLGLFVCKKLIEEAGGGINLESTPGIGTAAHVVLPVSQQAST